MLNCTACDDLMVAIHLIKAITCIKSYHFRSNSYPGVQLPKPTIWTISLQIRLSPYSRVGSYWGEIALCFPLSNTSPCFYPFSSLGPWGPSPTKMWRLKKEWDGCKRSMIWPPRNLEKIRLDLPSRFPVQPWIPHGPGNFHPPF